MILNKCKHSAAACFEITQTAIQSISTERCYFLIETTYSEFLQFHNATVLSYRRITEVKTVCGVKHPGETEFCSPRDVIWSEDVLVPLRSFTGEFMWIDFLSHLDDPVHRSSVLRIICRLYVDSQVLPLYLSRLILSPLVDKDELYLFQTSLRRGWIQQEISFGRLDVNLVKSFLLFCIQHDDYSLAATFIRRRSNAMKWLHSSQHEFLFLNERKYMTHGDHEGEGESNNDKSLKLNETRCGEEAYSFADLSDRIVATAFSKQVQDHLLQDYLGIEGVMNCSPPSGEIISLTEFYLVSAILTAMVTHQTLEEFTQLYRPSPQYLSYPLILKQTQRIIELVKGQKQFIQEILSSDSDFKLLLNDWLDQFVEKICCKQQFIPTDFFSAWQLLRSFGESVLTYEEDCYVAMTQIPTISVGLTWKPLIQIPLMKL